MRFLLLALALGACATGAAAQNRADRPADIVDVRVLIPSIVVDMRYAGSENFVGRRIDGYDAPVCLLTRRAAEALAAAQAELAPFGLGLKVFDCYRPARAVAHFARWAADPDDQARRADYYPRVEKSELFALGYLAERSGHSRGSTVDLTIVDLATGFELNMGGTYDLFDTRSWPTDQTVPHPQRANRLMLQSIMRAHGFRPLNEEWWHFTLNAEPYPDTYFDFTVR